MTYAPQMPDRPVFIQGGRHSDDRGAIAFANDVRLDPVRRFYLISNQTTDIIRAWQGHKRETKYFYAVEGEFVVAAVRLDDFADPSPDLQPESFILKAAEPGVLIVPPGHANGMRALTVPNKLLVLSDLLLEESNEDIYRFPAHFWFDWHLLKENNHGR
ncbi:MAG TPA: hypothetical protein PKN04_15950 [bacterium]|nr:hypothetical protein [bacterium]HNT67278.1 hypothetical protein [bacterium]